LFLERGRLVRQGFSINESNAAVVSQICRRLEGIPLAIELAAARLRALPPAEILARLQDCFDFLSHGPRGRSGTGDRHRTLRATVEWSYNLLPAAEQGLFRRLSVFRGGWALQAAEAVGMSGEEPVLDLLEALVEKSLAVLDERDPGRPRYRMLETIRQYGELQFHEIAERDEARRKQLSWCLSLAEQAEVDLSAGHEQQRWLAILAAEHDNMRAALECGYGNEAGVESALRIAVALVNFWYLRGHLSEGRRWLARAEDRLDDIDLVIRAKAHLSAGVLAWGQGDHATAQREYVASLGLWEQLGDRERCAAVLTNLGMAHFEAERNCARARQCLEESLHIYQTLGRAHRVPMVQLNLAAVCIAEGRHDEANALLDACLRAFEQSGDQHRLGFTHFNRAKSARLQGRRAEALEACGKAAAIAEQLGSEALLAPTLGVTAAIALDTGRTAVAQRLCRTAQQAYRRLGAAGPEQDIAEIFATIMERARAELGSANVDATWDCTKEANPLEVFREAALELGGDFGCQAGAIS
jgi:tetratricopeptide (TPR) repeat protein